MWVLFGFFCASFNLIMPRMPATTRRSFQAAQTPVLT
jgi:hypothetical protein